MSKKKKSPSRNPAVASIAARYEQKAVDIISFIPFLKETDHVVISLIHSVMGPDGNNTHTRYDVGVRKDNDSVKQIPGYISMNVFKNHLVKALRTSNKDGSAYQLLAAFFNGVLDNDGNMRLIIPETAYQWSIENNEIVPRITAGNAWNGVLVERGPNFVDGGFVRDSDKVEADPNDYLDNEIMKAGDTTNNFFEGIVKNASVGTHRLVSELSEYDKTAIIVFHKDDAGTIQVQGSIDESLNFMTSTVLRGGNLSVMLHSFKDEQLNDPRGIMLFESHQEIRGWSVSMGEIYPLSQRQLTDAYLRDFKTGDMLSIPANIDYLSAWEIPNQGKEQL